MLKIGEKAPSFHARSTKGDIQLQQSIGKQSIVLFFYSGDEDAQSITQLSMIKDHYQSLQNMDVLLLAIHPASIDKQMQLDETFSLPFPLVSDEDEMIRQLYNVGQMLGVATQKQTVYLINQDGIIIYAEDGNPKPEEWITYLQLSNTTDS